MPHDNSICLSSSGGVRNEAAAVAAAVVVAATATAVVVVSLIAPSPSSCRRTYRTYVYTSPPLCASQ